MLIDMGEVHIYQLLPQVLSLCAHAGSLGTNKRVSGHFILSENFAVCLSSCCTQQRQQQPWLQATAEVSSVQGEITLPSPALPEPIEITLVDDVELHSLHAVDGYPKSRSPSVPSVPEESSLNEASSQWSRDDDTSLLQRARIDGVCDIFPPEPVSIQTASPLCFGDEAGTEETNEPLDVGCRIEGGGVEGSDGMGGEATKQFEKRRNHAEDRSEHEEEGIDDLGDSMTSTRRNKDAAGVQGDEEIVDARPQSVWRREDYSKKQDNVIVPPVQRQAKDAATW